MDRGYLFSAALAAVGVVLGVAERASPDWSRPAPALLVLLGLVFAGELLWQALARRGIVPPLRMEHRFAAFILGGLAVALVPAIPR